MISELHELYPNSTLGLSYNLSSHICACFGFGQLTVVLMSSSLCSTVSDLKVAPLSPYIYLIPKTPTEIKKQVCTVASPHKWSMTRACKDHCNGINMSASFKHQPLITSSSSSSIHVDNTCTPNHSFGHVSKESSKDCDSSSQAGVSSRWNPTPEQVEVLKEMFRLGTRSPTAEHIQQITTLLRRFGRVEGKNVFYWFQNHKARERQRRRCNKLETTCQEQKCERKKPGVRRACFEVEESISVGNLLSEEPVSVHRTKTSSMNGWTQLELHHITPTSQLTLNPDAANTQQRQYQMLELFPLGKGSNNVSEEQTITTSMSTSFSPSHFVEFLPPKI